jgi:hypothetical protein
VRGRESPTSAVHPPDARRPLRARKCWSPLGSLKRTATAPVYTGGQLARSPHRVNESGVRSGLLPASCASSSPASLLGPGVDRNRMSNEPSKRPGGRNVRAERVSKNSHLRCGRLLAQAADGRSRGGFHLRQHGRGHSTMETGGSWRTISLAIPHTIATRTLRLSADGNTLIISTHWHSPDTGRGPQEAIDRFIRTETQR